MLLFNWIENYDLLELINLNKIQKKSSNLNQFKIIFLNHKKNLQIV